jgi:hypothetical protein
MDDAVLRNLASLVLGAATECRNLQSDNFPVSIVLERLWLLQDSLARLVDTASDHPEDAAMLLGSLRRDVIQEVSESVIVSRESHSINVAAARQSRTAIQHLLTELQRVSETRPLAEQAAR